MQAEGLTTEVGIPNGGFVSLFLKYPIDMLLLQLKHLFGGLDITYHAVYVQDLHTPRILMSLINYGCPFIAGVIVGARIRDQGLTWHGLPLLLA